MPEQNLSQKSQQQSQLRKNRKSPMTSKNTSEPIIPTNSVKTPEDLSPKLRKMAQGKRSPKQETSKLIDSAKKSDVIPEKLSQESTLPVQLK